jgi:hypothetical protein
MELEREHPGVKQSMIKALANVAPRHLLDTRLNPPADLVRRAAEPRTAPVAVARPRTIRVMVAEPAVPGDRQISASSARGACETPDHDVRSAVVAPAAIAGGAVSSPE